ncbi:hypothetical protein HYX15_01260 [Candidatus Woesearchaeota archaeon]|nr:hypothetical protein [Candidatus Woesearchaeota archaeon]
MKKKGIKLLFVVTGFGYGDSIRVETIINEFLKRDKLNDVLILGYDLSYKYFKNKFKVLEVEGYKFPDYGLEFKTHRFLIKNYYLPISWILTWRKHRKALKLFDPDLIISDFEPMAVFISRSLNKKCISIFGYDPKVYDEYPNKNNILDIQSKFIERIYDHSNKIIIPSFKKKHNASNRIYINPIVREYKKKKNLAKKLGIKNSPIIIMLGGSDYGIELARKIINLNKRYNENLIIFGGTTKISKSHYIFKDDIMDYLAISKGVITLAGNLSLSETLFMKKPMLVFPIKNHIEQQLNAYMVKEYAIIGGDDINESLENFLKNINNIKKKLNKIKLKFDGAKEIVDIIYDMEKKND